MNPAKDMQLIHMGFNNASLNERKREIPMPRLPEYLKTILSYAKMNKALTRLGEMETNGLIQTILDPMLFDRFLKEQDAAPSPFIYGSQIDGSNVKYKIRLHIRCEEKQGFDRGPAEVLKNFINAT